MRYPKCNLHTHTTYCDGKNTPEEMVLEAIRLGMTVLGFSGHAYTSFEPCSMTEEGTLAYREEVSRLKGKYADRIRILCGIEQDFYSDHPAEGFDYIIGSVHYLPKAGSYHPVDADAESFQRAVDEHFDGNVYHFAREYYETLAQVATKTKCDIVGHFDLLEKFNEGGRLFDSTDYRYRRPAIDALDELLKKDLIFEINTGAIGRGYRKLPYPSSYFLRRIAEKRGRVMINSDAHAKEQLLCAFGDAVQLAHSCGVGGLTVPTAHGWEVRPLGSI